MDCHEVITDDWGSGWESSLHTGVGFFVVRVVILKPFRAKPCFLHAFEFLVTFSRPSADSQIGHWPFCLSMVSNCSHPGHGRYVDGALIESSHGKLLARVRYPSWANCELYKTSYKKRNSPVRANSLWAELSLPFGCSRSVRMKVIGYYWLAEC